MPFKWNVEVNTKYEPFVKYSIGMCHINVELQKDKLNTDYLLIKKNIVSHKDKNVHKLPGQSTIPDTGGR